MGCSKPATQLGLPDGSTQNVSTLFRTFLPKPPIAFALHGDEDVRSNEQSQEIPSALPRVEVRPSPGRGSGLFAVDRIPAFTRILEDDALISLAEGEDLPEAWQKYCLLPPDDKKIIDDLTYPSSHLAEKQKSIITQLKQRGYGSEKATKMARLNARWQTNAFTTEGPKIGTHWLRALFGQVAKINHSCTPNAHSHCRAPATQFVYAVRDIEAGEEIEIAYFDITMPYADRQARAKYMGFECTCPACSLTGHLALSNYEQRLAIVHKHISVDFNTPNPWAYIDSTQTAINIAHSAEYPWLGVSLPRLYQALFSLRMRLQFSNTQLDEAVMKGVEWQDNITGPDSPESRIARKVREDARKLNYGKPRK